MSITVDRLEKVKTKVSYHRSDNVDNMLEINIDRDGQNFCIAADLESYIYIVEKLSRYFASLNKTVELVYSTKQKDIFATIDTIGGDTKFRYSVCELDSTDEEIVLFLTENNIRKLHRMGP